MPTYEYACKECGEHLDVVQKFTDDALTTCPSCQGPLRKVFGSIGISFKGSGFYKNDSRSKTSSSSTTSSASSSGSDGASTSGNGSGGSSSSSDSSSSTPAASPAKPAATKTSDAKSA